MIWRLSPIQKSSIHATMVAVMKTMPFDDLETVYYGCNLL
jgi:hypothetical protein